MSVSLHELVGYWLGELTAEREGVVEDALFSDAEVARRLDALARLEAGILQLIREGRLQSSVARKGLAAFDQAGLRLREYRLAPGQTVPCTIADEDLVVIRLQGGFTANEVDVVMHGEFEGLPHASETYSGVPVDGGEVILVYPGDRIRALPRSHFRYEVRAGGLPAGNYHLDHRPDRGAPSVS